MKLRWILTPVWLVLFLLAVPTANAQWRDPGDLGTNTAVTLLAAAPDIAQLAAPMTETETTTTVEAPADTIVIDTATTRPTVCNPAEGCGLAPGQIIVFPDRNGDICNPYKGCGITIPAGGILINPPRPNIPCGYAKPCAP